MADNIVIRDLIYLDFDKLASIASQLEGGLLQEIQSTIAKQRELEGGIDVKLANLGGAASQSQSRLETRVLHHDILKRVEETLVERGAATDLTMSVNGTEVTAELVRSKLSDASYLLAEGWVQLQDYQRINKFADDINPLFDYFAEIQREAIKQTEIYKEVAREIEDEKHELSQIRDKNQKALLRMQIEDKEHQIDQFIESATQTYGKLPKLAT